MGTRIEASIVLIGFKHVGKTQIGRQMAKVLNKPFIDLDREVEKSYEITYQQPLSCRQIMHLLGEANYRELESQVLQQMLKQASSVISLGGGTIVNINTHDLIKNHHLIHVVASRGIVFERIMIEGRPAFFDANEDPYESFNRLWDEREVVYRNLTTSVVDNSGTIEHAVQQAISYL